MSAFRTEESPFLIFDVSTMTAPHSAPLFAAIEMAPRDPILGITEAFNADQHPEKTNLGVGVYYDDNGKVPLLGCVQKAESLLMEKLAPRTYLPIEGLAAYDKAVQELVFGANSEVVTSKRAITAQAIGGTGALVRGLVSLIEGQGNELRYNCEVDEILTHQGRATGVRLAGGEKIECDLVVSNAEIAWTYSKLLRNTPRRVWTDRKLARADYSMSLFVWYFGTRRQYTDCYHHTIVLGPRYRGLLKDIFRKKVLADDFSLYLHRPTANDPSLAPEGCDSFYVLSPVPHLDSGTDWKAMAAPYKERIAERLEETVLPGLRQEIVSERVMTPLDFQDRLLSTKGAAFGLEPKLLQSAWFRPHNISADVKGLYLTGASTHPGAGVPSVLSSAAVVDKLLPVASEWRASVRA